MSFEKERIRVGIVSGAPAPYREPLFARLAREPRVELRVFYASSGHEDVGWKETAGDHDYDRVVVPNVTPRRLSRWPVIGYGNVSLGRSLREFRPDYLIIYGYNQLFHWVAFQHALRSGVPFALRSDSNIHLQGNGSWRRRMRRSLMRRIVSKAHACLCVGTANREFWHHQGAAPEQIFMAPYAVDNDRIASVEGEAKPRGDGPLRLIYVGRLVARKGVDRLLRAFVTLSRECEARLTLVGDGPRRAHLEAMVPDELRAKVVWTGKLTNDEAVRQMKNADVFVLPSLVEPWGLVVNEAMAAGLPVIAHRAVGAAIDLIQPGITGWTIDEIDSESLMRPLRLAAKNPLLVQKMGQAARRRVRKWSFDATAQGMLDAIEDAVTREPVHRGRIHAA